MVQWDPTQAVAIIWASLRLGDLVASVPPQSLCPHHWRWECSASFNSDCCFFFYLLFAKSPQSLHSSPNILSGCRYLKHLFSSLFILQNAKLYFHLVLFINASKLVILLNYILHFSTWLLQCFYSYVFLFCWTYVFVCMYNVGLCLLVGLLFLFIGLNNAGWLGRFFLYLSLIQEIFVLHAYVPGMDIQIFTYSKRIINRL